LTKYAAALICWITFIILAFSINSGSNIPEIQSGTCDFKFTPQPNRLDAFSYIHFDSQKNYRPIYAVAFESLILKNSNLGPFTTAMFKKATMNDFQLRFYNYDSAVQTVSAEQIESANISELPEIKTSKASSASDIPAVDMKELISNIAGELSNPSAGYIIGNFNFAGVSEVYANNFDCRFFHENGLTLSIRCKRAAASYKNSNIELRGHVIIKTGDGAVLESNFVEWDENRNIFNVNGSYILNRNGSVKTGRNASFNSELKEEYKCIAKL
jgi:hypothetical protein